MNIEVQHGHVASRFNLGGGCVQVDAIITIDPGLSNYMQILTLAHEVIEARHPDLDHDRLDDTAQAIAEGAHQLGLIVPDED